MNDSVKQTPQRRRDRPGDLGRRASILTWIALASGAVGLYFVRQISRQPLLTFTSLMILGAVLVLAVVASVLWLKPDIKAQPKKRPGFFLTALLMGVMLAFAAYSLAYWWVERHGQPVEIIYQLSAKSSNQLDWKPVVGKAPAIRLTQPEPLFMSFAPGSQYPFPLLKGPAGFWVLDNDPDVAGNH